MKKYVIARRTKNGKLVYYSGDYEFYTNEIRVFDSLASASMALVNVVRDEALSKFPPQDFIIKEVEL